MNRTELKAAVNKGNFVKWVKRHKKDETVGRRGSTGGCPIAKFVRNQCKKSDKNKTITVGCYSISISTPDMVISINTPSWASKFIQRFDMRTTSKKAGTKAHVLESMKKVQ